MDGASGELNDKGGFYWCFGSRDELLAALLERWERLGTREIIEAVEQLDAASSARELLARVAQRMKSNSPEAVRSLRVEHALSCAATDPRVAPTLQRVNAARLGYLAQVLRRDGLSAKVARQRAMLAHASYVGLVQLRATGHDEEIAVISGQELVEVYLTMLLAPPVGTVGAAKKELASRRAPKTAAARPTAKKGR